MPLLPVCVPRTPKNALAYTRLVIERNWVSSLCLDPEVNFLAKLEQGVASYLGVRHATAVTSGTTALQLAMAALRIGPGDEVIVPSCTMIASATAVAHAGARPVVVDVDPTTYCIDVEAAAAAITPRTRAIMPVHLYGFPADMDALRALAAKHDLALIEDAAEALGTELHGRKAGALGDVACFSFYANKVVTSGEGGLLVTDRDDVAERARRLKDHAFGEPRFIHDELGFNFRMSNLTAAYAYASFEELPDAVERRIANARRYDEALAGVPGLVLPPRREGAVNSHWMYALRIQAEAFGRSKAEVRKLLRERYEIDTRDFFYPLHLQPALRQRGLVPEGLRLPVSERLWEEGLYLPSSTDLRPEDIERVAAALRELARA